MSRKRGEGKLPALLTAVSGEEEILVNILLIVPYPKLEKTVRKIYEESFKRKNLQVDIRVLRDREVEEIGAGERYDLLIGRGNTAAILKKKYPDKSILEIPITGYDIMRSILVAKSRFESKRIAIIVSSAYNHDENVLSMVFGSRITVRKVSDYSRTADLVDGLIREGYDTVIGGYSVESSAKGKNIHALTVETGEEAVTQILNDAVNMTEVIQTEREKKTLYETITQSSKEGIVYVGRTGLIELVNQKMLQLGGNSKRTVNGEKLSEVYPFFREGCETVLQKGTALNNEIARTGSSVFSVDYMPVTVGNKVMGVVITCQNVKKIQQIESQLRKKLSEKGLVANYTFADIIRKSELMEKTIKNAEKYAQVSSSILIVGETGTGKELMAQSIHNASNRHDGPFVAVNCAALPENLLESELFGYVDGAFTGSRKGGKIGFFEQAHTGTLFLDEISELPLSFQGKFLRALQEKQIRRIGDDKVVNVNVRIIAATNRNLALMVKEKKFRQDLLYRLDVLKIYIPPLRERKEDILPLFYSFIQKYNKKFDKEIRFCTKEAKHLLESYAFEGNIRELRNLAERIAVICEEEQITEYMVKTALYPEDIFAVQEHLSQKEKVDPYIQKEMSEQEKIAQALHISGGKKKDAAALLGMDRTTLWRKMKFYHME